MSGSRRRKTHPLRELALLAWRFLLSFLYLMTSAMLLLFGYIVGWDLDSGRPVVGVAMMLAGIAVFILGPRATKRITGKDPLDPPPYVLP